MTCSIFTSNLFLSTKVYSSSMFWSSLKMFLYLHCDCMVTSKHVPCILFDLTSIDPPILFTILLQMLKPRPVPYLFLWLLSSSFPKSKNNLLRSSSSMPIPLSLIEILYFTYNKSLSLKFSVSPSTLLMLSLCFSS